MHIDLFCKVVDNFGDAGVCWRLARQLANTQQCQVRLWIDDLGCLAKLCPELAVDRPEQICAGVRICRWCDDLAEVLPSEVVVEAFACGLPEAYLQAMARRAPAPVWVNLEYLTAEAWADGCHALPSPHPRLPLTCHFYFPGFTAATGGLPGESDLRLRRDSFRADATRVADFWRNKLGIEPPRPEDTTVSLFSYDNPALPQFAKAWRAASSPVRALVPAGSRPSVLAELGLSDEIGRRSRCGSLTAQVIPFLCQDDFDRLLWACDVNFVRGEDSFVRALWAGAPFVWQIYPQSEEAHHAKLEAFLARHAGHDACSRATTANATIHRFWNGMQSGDANVVWQEFLAAGPALKKHAAAWANRTAENGFLAENLARFCHSKLKC